MYESLGVALVGYDVTGLKVVPKANLNKAFCMFKSTNI